MGMTIGTLTTVAEAFEDGLVTMGVGVSETLTDLAKELTEKHSRGTDLLEQPTISAYADVSREGGMGIMIHFGEREIVLDSVPDDATGFGLKRKGSYLHLAEDVLELIPVMSERDYVLNLLHRGLPRLKLCGQKGEAA